MPARVVRQEIVQRETIYLDFACPTNELVSRMSRVLSSPPTSYVHVIDTLTIPTRHRQPYPERLKSSKVQIQELHNEVQELRNELRQQAMINPDWETRNRIAQGLNDDYVQNSCRVLQEYFLLREYKYGYLPYVLSTWAVFKRYEPVSRFLDQMSERDEKRHLAKGTEICAGGLEEAVEAVWHDMDDGPRSLMITMWLSRSSSRSAIAHPIPTVGQGLSIIRSDLRLSQAEVVAAERVISIAVDQYNEPLFSD